MDREVFYPELNIEGMSEAQVLMNNFKKDARLTLDSLLGDYLGKVYCDIIPQIESDSWSNYRNAIMDGYKDYNNREIREWDFKAIRQKIYKDFKEEIDKDLNQDNLDRIEELEATVKRLMGYNTH